MAKTNSVLRALRAHLKITQREAAAQAVVDAIQWAQVETGADGKSFSTAGWLAIWGQFGPTLTLLGYGCDDLMRGRKRSGVRRAA
jgi:transcriptional regulator with XRE-family HTH domain